VSVFQKVVKEIPDGTILYTPVMRKPFEITKKADLIIFSVGNKTKIPIPKAIWDGIPKFLSGQDWVDIGSGYNQAKEQSLQEYIDNHPSRGTQHSSDANYVASVLEHLKLAEVIHRRPSRLKLK